MSAFKFPPEVFPLIASHLPLYATPSTLLSLASTNHAIYGIVQNLLYSCLILKNENDAISVFQKILSNPDLGKAVRELHVMSQLTAAAVNGEKAFDTVTGLKKLIKAGALPYIHTLTLRLVLGSHHDDKYWRDASGFGHLPADFWDDLQSKCPRVRTIVLSGIGDRRGDSLAWLHESGIYELKGFKDLTHLGLSFAGGSLAQSDGMTRILKNIHSLSSSLHTLVLNVKYDDASPILSLDFPRLRSLTLGMFIIPHISEAMAFWKRHPSIEKLMLPNTERNSRWFSEQVEGDLLPNLKYLEASFRDVRSLIPILHRLTRLSIQQNLNAQVPYLLRFLIPTGLPNLTSLEIDQEWSSNRDTIRRHEGSQWYETPDGKFHEEKRIKKAARKLTDDYIHSIVKGAPNLKELCLHSTPLHPSSVIDLAPELAEFTKLERLYYRGVNDDKLSLRTPAMRDAFHASSLAIAEKSKKIESITDISTSPSYMTTLIRRNHAGDVEEAIPVEGYGMIICSEDEAFPRNPAAIVLAC